MTNKIKTAIAGLILLLLTANLYSGDMIFKWNKVNESGEIRDMHFMPEENKFILTTESDIQVRDTETGELINTFPATDKGLFELTNDSTRFVVTTGTQASRDKEITLELKDLNTMEVLQSASLILDEGEKDPVHNTELYYHYVDIALDPIRPHAYVIVRKTNRWTDIDVDTTRLLVYNYETMEQIADITPEGFKTMRLSLIDVSNDGRYLALMNNGKTFLTVFDLNTMELISKFQLYDEILSDPDDNWCTTDDVLFSSLNTQKIYYTGAFPKYNKATEKGFFIFDLNENKISDVSFNNIYGGIIRTNSNETKVLRINPYDVLVLDLVNKTIETKIKTWPKDSLFFYPNASYSKNRNWLLGSGGSKISLVMFDFLTTINENSDVDNTVYPNPTNDLVTIEYNCGSSEINYTLFDINGTLLLSESTPNNNSLQLDFSKYPIGTFYLKLHCGTENITYKIIKEG